MSLVSSLVKIRGTVPFAVIAILIAGFLLFNAEALFEDWSEGFQSAVIIYLMMILAAMFFTRERTLQATAKGFIAGFGLAFLLGTVIFTLVVRGAGGGGLALFPSQGVVGAIIAFQWMVAYSEESMFRGWLTPAIGILPAAGAFAVYHIAAYSLILGAGFTPMALITPAVFGIAFGVIYWSVGIKRAMPGLALGLCVGFHMSLNLAVLGVNLFGGWL